MPPDLGIRLGPLAPSHPVICGSGEHVSSLDQLKAALDAGAAAVVAKSANESEAARRQSDATAWVFLEDGVTMLNRSGLVQERWESWLEILARADAHARELGSWVAASLIPASADALPRL